MSSSHPELQDHASGRQNRFRLPERSIPLSALSFLPYSVNQSSGFCSDQPGCGKNSGYSFDTILQIFPDSSIRRSFTAEVPRSTPINTWRFSSLFRKPAAKTSAPPFCLCVTAYLSYFISYKLAPWILCRISYTLRLVVTDLFNRYTNIFEYFEECFSKCPNATAP